MTASGLIATVVSRYTSRTAVENRQILSVFICWSVRYCCRCLITASRVWFRQHPGFDLFWVNTAKHIHTALLHAKMTGVLKKLPYFWLIVSEDINTRQVLWPSSYRRQLALPINVRCTCWSNPRSTWSFPPMRVAVIRRMPRAICVTNVRKLSNIFLRDRFALMRGNLIVSTLPGSTEDFLFEVYFAPWSVNVSKNA